jgi:hypothetical protein
MSASIHGPSLTPPHEFSNKSVNVRSRHLTLNLPAQAMNMLRELKRYAQALGEFRDSPFPPLPQPARESNGDRSARHWIAWGLRCFHRIVLMKPDPRQFRSIDDLFVDRLAQSSFCTDHASRVAVGQYLHPADSFYFSE